MRQFDVYENPSDRTRDVAPYLIVLSSHLLRHTSIVIVAPLLNDRATAIAELEVTLTFEGSSFVLSLTDLSGLEAKQLKRRAGSLADQEDAIRRGLDRVFTGF